MKVPPMKDKPILTHKKQLALILCICGFSVAIWSFLSNNNTTRQFHNAIENLFQEEMLGNTLNMHYTIAYPENYGITDYEAILPSYDKSSHEKSQTALQEDLSFYKGLDSTELASEDAYTLSLLISYLENT